MSISNFFARSPPAKYARAIKAAPNEIINNRKLFLTAALYATASIPLTWDQGSASVVPSLPGFEKTFNISSGANAGEITNFVSIVYIGAGVGSALSFLINDRIGRLWSFRLYSLVWIIGQLIATGSSGSVAALYVARVVAGLGIGALTVTGPISLVEIAPSEIRGLISAWFSVGLLLSLFVSVFCVYGVFIHVAAGPLQYQIVWFSPCIFMALMCALSFAGSCIESPRWLYLVGREKEATRNLEALRGLPATHTRVASEIADINSQIAGERSAHGAGARSNSWIGIKSIFRETFTEKANLRRVQQALLSYALAQLSGANSVTSYFVPILKIVGATDGTTTNALFLSGMYSFSKFCFTIIASFFIVDALGRRQSLFIGTTIQMISDLYLGVYIKYKQANMASAGAGQGAIAMIFFHGFGYSVGLLVLPYIFGAEVWPNQLRSFGSALAQTFHWLFYFGINRATPSLLTTTNNWGAFIFFAGWCFVALLYVFLVVPETAGLSMEEFDDLFKGPWLMAWRSAPAKTMYPDDGRVVMDGRYHSENDSQDDSVEEQQTKSKSEIA